MRKHFTLHNRSIACLLLIVSMLVLPELHAQRQRKVTNVNISPQIKQYLEHLPPGYNDPANANKKYPLIIYWHGMYEATSYTGGSLDPLFVKGLPQKIESFTFPDVVTYMGTNYSYIVITPQYTDGGANAYDVEAAIDYITARYRVDRNRVYMTGISKGAGMCFSYANAGAGKAKKVAAIAPLAACEALNWSGAANVAAAGMRVWGLHCPQDNICHYSTTTGSVDLVNMQQSNPQLAKYTLTPAWSPSYPHDIFWIPYEPSYTTAESGGLNMYNWFIQFSQNLVLPVSLRNFTARLSNGKVNLEWTTSAENNSRRFILERAGRDMQFSEIARVDAAGHSGTDKKYAATDAAPLHDLNFYRLSQVDADGKVQYFETRKVLNTKKAATVVIAPNPVKTVLTAFVNI
ncbi:MAG TPA: hypothetical protein VD996_11735, partial [Chitinophagaceae bacterium]|nr:hypothetical protein [Chitinophagaceae bacterium]